MNYLDELEKIIIKESKPLDIQMTGDIDHVKRLSTIEDVCKKIINFLIISEKKGIINDVNRCNDLIRKCFEIVEKENKYETEKFHTNAILSQYLKKAKEGSLLSVEQVRQLELEINQISEQIIMFLESLYPLESYNLMTKDEKAIYDSLCQKFESLKKEYELSHALLNREDWETLPYKEFYVPRLDKHGLISTLNVLDYDKIDPICDHNLEIAKQYVDEYIEFEKNNDVANMDRTKRIILQCFYLFPSDRTIYHRILSEYIISKGYNVETFYLPLGPGIHEMPNGDMVLVDQSHTTKKF